MTTSVASILARARHLTLDESGVRWVDAELVNWLNDGQLELVGHKPTASVVNGAIALIAGVRQTVPSGATALLDITHNSGTGEACTLVQRADLERSLPTWVNATTTIDAEHYMVDEDDPKTFLVYPPNTGAGSLQGRTAALPTTMADETVNLGLGDEYAPILLDYLLYRIWSKNSNHPGNSLKAETAHNNFLRALGVKIQAQFVYSPKRNLEEDSNGASSV